ncbi:MAG: hypothetical protein JXR68_11685 [Bacteroidales bacterium]|nr:hypothetical protein [Bacteroidales bacterium]
MDYNEFNALLKLLSDPDDFVSNSAKQKLIMDFDNIYDKFNKAVELSDNELFVEKANSLYTEYNFLKTKKNLENWVNSADKDFLKGIYYLNRFFNPAIEFSALTNFFENLKRKFIFDIKNLSPIEQIRLLNFVLFKNSNIKVILDNETIDNNLITSLLNHKKASPALVTIIYFILAKKLDIPLYLISGKNILMLAYFLNESNSNAQKYYFHKKIHYNFFVNPPDRGYIYTNEEIKFILNKFNIKSTNDFTIITPTLLLKMLINKFIILAHRNNSFYLNYLIEIQKIFL